MGYRSKRRLGGALMLILLSAGFGLAYRATGRAAEQGTEALFSLKIQDESGAPLVARVRLAPVSWSERVRLGVYEDWMSAVPESGLSLRLPAGHYRAFVSKGPEWSLVQLDVDLAPRASLKRQATLRHQVSLPGYRGADLHVHTKHSEDARERGGVDAVALQAEGVSIAVATDHNVLGDLGPGIAQLAGAEITTWAPEVGHFNAFPLRTLPDHRGTTPERLFRELRKDPSVFIQINHPRLDDHISYFHLGGFDGRAFSRPGFNLDADGLEIWNGYDIGRIENVRRLLGEYRRLLARGHHLTATGGSDSHGARRHPPGYPRTFVRVEARGSAREQNPEQAGELAAALKRGAAFVSNGPLIALEVNGKEPGGRVHVDTEGYVNVRLQVRAASWLSLDKVSLWADDRLVWSKSLKRPRDQLGPLVFRASVRVPVGGAKTLLAVVDGGSGLEQLLGRRDVTPFAFTNPVYLSAAMPEQETRK